MNKAMVCSVFLTSLVHTGMIFVHFPVSFNFMDLAMKQADYSMEVTFVSSSVVSKPVKEEEVKEVKHLIEKSVDPLIERKIIKKEEKRAKVEENVLDDKPKPLLASDEKQGIKSDAVCLNNIPPKYPLMARNLGYEGKVELSIGVRADGSVNYVTILKSSGHKILDKCAKKAAYTWKFAPALKNSRSVESTVVIPVVFRLED